MDSFYPNCSRFQEQDVFRRWNNQRSFQDRHKKKLQLRQSKKNHRQRKLNESKGWEDGSKQCNSNRVKAQRLNPNTILITLPS